MRLPRTRHFVGELYRMRWPLLVCLAVAFGREWGYLPRTSPVTVWLSGLAKMFLGVIAAHVVVQQAFPYMDGRGLLFRALALFEFADGSDYEERTIAAYAFVGVCILRGLVYAAAILAVAQALG